MHANSVWGGDSHALTVELTRRVCDTSDAAAMLPGGHQPRITRLSKAITAVLVIVAAIEYYVPSTSAYIALVPGRCASSELQLALDRWTGGSRKLATTPTLGSGAQDAALRLEPAHCGLLDNECVHRECMLGWQS